MRRRSRDKHVSSSLMVVVFFPPPPPHPPPGHWIVSLRRYVSSTFDGTVEIKYSNCQRVRNQRVQFIEVFLFYLFRASRHAFIVYQHNTPKKGEIIFFYSTTAYTCSASQPLRCNATGTLLEMFQWSDTPC
jgi:hypothetical protein